MKMRMIQERQRRAEMGMEEDPNDASAIEQFLRGKREDREREALDDPSQPYRPEEDDEDADEADDQSHPMDGMVVMDDDVIRARQARERRNLQEMQAGGPFGLRESEGDAGEQDEDEDEEEDREEALRAKHQSDLRALMNAFREDERQRAPAPRQPR